MRAGGWLAALAVLAVLAVAVPQEVSPLGSAVAGDLETRARCGHSLIFRFYFASSFSFHENNKHSFQQLYHQGRGAAAGSVSDIYI